MSSSKTKKVALKGKPQTERAKPEAPIQQITEENKAAEACSSAAEQDTTICPVCQELVNETDRAIECEICLSWFHQACCKVSDSLYNIISSDENDQISWYCTYCKRGAKQIMSKLQQVNKRQNKMDSELIKISSNQDKTDDRVDNIEKRLHELEQNKSVPKAPGISNTTEIIAKSVQEMETRYDRSNNVIFFNVPEDGTDDIETRKKSDLDTANHICREQLEVTASIEKTVRLGAKNESNKRPLKVCLEKKEQRTNILRNAKKLRNSTNEMLSQVYIAPDLTPQQREDSKKLRQLRQTNQQALEDTGDTESIWIIRNGQLKKVRKHQQ